MARQRIIHVVVHASSAQGIFEAVAKGMKHAAGIVDAEVALVATEPLLERFTEATLRTRS